MYRCYEVANRYYTIVYGMRTGIPQLTGGCEQVFCSCQKAANRFYLVARGQWTQVFPQNYRWQNRKVRCLCRSFLKVGLPRRNEECLSRQEMGGWSVGAAGPVQQPDCAGVESRGRGAGPILCTLRPPPFPTPGQAWGTYVVCGCCLAGTTARTNALTQIVPNSSSLYTLFYSVNYNSVGIS